MNALNVLVIEQKPNSKELEKILINQGINTVTMAIQELDISQLIDTIRPIIILFNASELTDMVLQVIVKINEDYAVPIILFSDADDTKAINKVIKTGVSAYIVNGIESKRVKSIIHIAIARFNEQKKLKDELTQTKLKLEERKLIDRAKGILIKTRGFSEDESYHTLRKLAMDRNIVISEMAKNVISMAELLK